MPRFFSYKQNWINIFIRQIFGFFANFGKNSNFSLFINIEWLEMIIRHKKWSIIMQLAAYIEYKALNFQQFVWFVWLCSNVQIVQSETHWNLKKNIYINYLTLNILQQTSYSWNCLAIHRDISRLISHIGTGQN